MILVHNEHVTLARSETLYNRYLCITNSEVYMIDRAQADAVYALSVRFAAKQLSVLMYKSEVIMTMSYKQYVCKVTEKNACMTALKTV